jgi:hypothetical protein
MERRTTAWALVLTAGAFALRLAYLLHSHPFIDEFTTILAARAVLQSGLPVLPSGLFYEHGLLFTYLDAPFVALAGEEVLFAVARLPSLLIGTLNVPLMYAVGRRWVSPRAGLLAAALLAFSPEGMVWGGRARMYALAQLLVLYLAFLVYETSRSRADSGGRPGRLLAPRWLALPVLLAVLLTQLGALILVPPLLAGALAVGWLERPAGARPWFLRRAGLVQGAGLAGVVGLSLLIKRLGRPMGAYALQEGGAGQIAGELLETVTYQAGLVLDGTSAVEFLAREFGVPHHIWLAVVALLGGLLALALWLQGRPGDRASGAAYAYLYLWLVFGLTVVEMVTLLEPWRRNPRYLVIALPLFYVLVSASLERVIGGMQPGLAGSQPGHRGTGAPGDRENQEAGERQSRAARIFQGLLALLLIVFVAVQAWLLVPDVQIAYRTPEPAYEEAFRYVAGEWQPGDVVLTMNTSAAGLLLGRTDALRFAIQEDAEQFLLDVDAGRVDRWLGAPWVGSAADLNRVLNQHERVWFVADTIRLPVYYRGDWLGLVAVQMELAWSGDEALVYRTRPNRLALPETPHAPLNASFDELVRLDGYAIQFMPERSGIQLALFWTALAPMQTDYTVFAHLRDVENRTITQRDAQPLDGAYPTGQWRAGERVITPMQIDLPADLPAGEYWLYVGLYQLDTLIRLPLAGDASGENAVRIGPVALKGAGG